eukprot:258313_1
MTTTKSEHKSHSQLNKNTVNDGLFTWRWNDDNFLENEIYERKDQKRILSNHFKIANCDWQLIAYPKGDGSDTSKYGVFNLYLEISPSKNTHIKGKTIIANIRLYNYETGVSFTECVKFGKWIDDDKIEISKYDHGWSDQMLRLDELQNKYDRITLGCYIKILQIKNEQNNKITYECPMRLEHKLLRTTTNSKLGYIFSMKWQLTHTEIYLMKNCRNGQSFESQIINEMWCFRVFPNGIDPDTKNQVVLCLVLCLLPPAITKLTVQLKLKCLETNTEYKSKLRYSYDGQFYHWKHKHDDDCDMRMTRTKSFTSTKDKSKNKSKSKRKYKRIRKTSVSGDDDDFEPLCTHVFNQQKQITFIADIEVLRHFDRYDNEIKHELDWKECYKVSDINKVPKLEMLLNEERLLEIQDTMPGEIVWNIQNTYLILPFYDSSICVIKGLKWFLRFIPNGSLLCLCLYELPEDVVEVIVNFRIFVDEIKWKSHTDIVRFDSVNWNYGYSLGDQECSNAFWLNGMLTIKCYINIIKIICVNDFKLKYETCMKLFNEKYIYRYEWCIDNEMINMFLRCKIGEKYESDIYENQWCLKCFPNGMNENNKGEIQLFLQICMFPKEITNIRLKMKLLCVELNKIWSTLTEFDVNGKTSKGWSLGTLYKSELNGCENITFVAEVVIIEQFKNKNKTKSGEFKLKISNKNDIFKWNITDENLLNRFIVSKNLEKYESEIFEINGFKFFLKIYPNGYKNDFEGYAM